MRLKSLSLLLSTALSCSVSTAARAELPDPPAAAAEVEAATALAHNDLKTPLFLCHPDSTKNVVLNLLKTNLGQWVEPIKLFDNLYYIGNRFVGSYVVKTSAGLILFDTGSDADTVRDHIVPGLEKLGLDPKQIRYAIVTHGGWDHFGGGAYLQKRFGTRVGLSDADWKFIETSPADWPEIANHPAPKHDLVIQDGQKLTLGDTTITLYVTPGHTHGTVSAIVPVRDQGQVRVFSLLGSTSFPAALDYNPHDAGLKAYDVSVLRFARISADARAVGLLNTHVFADGGLERLDAAAATGNGSPLLIGADAVQRYYGILDHCLRAAIIRAEANPPSTAP